MKGAAKTVPVPVPVPVPEVKEEVHSDIEDFYLDLGSTGRTLEFRNPPGFSLYPEQVVNELIQNSFQFNLLCVGEIGVGKSSFINTLLEKEIFECNNPPMKADCISLHSTNVLLSEDNVKVALSITETVGYGDHTDKADLEGVLVNYVQEQFKKYVTDSMVLNRSEDIKDTRIHLCLFFISPTFQALRTLDILCLKELAAVVNLVPIISKADILSKEELNKFKSHILQEFAKNKIEIYKFPLGDKFSMKKNEESNKRMPFAVINSNDIEVRENKKIRVRKYPWGSVAIDDEKITDLCSVRDIIKLNMCDIVESTEKKHYERFRGNYIKYHGFDAADVMPSPDIKIKSEGKNMDSINKNYAKLMNDVTELHEKDKKELQENFKNQFAQIDKNIQELKDQMVTRTETISNKKDKHKGKK